MAFEGETTERSRNVGTFANQPKADQRPDSSSEIWSLCSFFLGQRHAAGVAGSPVGEYERAGHQEEMNDDDQTCSVPKRTTVSGRRRVVRSLSRPRPAGRWVDQTTAEKQAPGQFGETSQAVRH